MAPPHYSSPEQIQSTNIDQRTDIYSFGCLMFATLTGKPPFFASNQLEVYDMHLNKPVPGLKESGYTGEQSEALDEIIAKAMAKNRDHRFQSFYQLKAELIELMPEEARPLMLGSEEKYDKNSFKAATFLLQYKWALLASIALLGLLGFVMQSNESRQKPAITTTTSVQNQLEASSQDEDKWTFFSRMKSGMETWTNIDCRMSDKHFKMLRGRNVRSVALYAMRLNGSGLRYLVNEPLERLVMAESKIVDKNLHYIGDLKKLKLLDISYTWINDEGVATISELPELRELGIAGCRELTSRSIDHILKFAPNLESLNLSYTPVGKSGYEKLAQMKNLKTLDLEYSDLTDEMLEPVFKLKLETLILSKNKNLTDATLKSLEPMKRLKLLRIEECPKFTPRAIANLQRALPKCTIQSKSANKKQANEFF